MRILYLAFDDMRRHFAGTVHIRKVVEGLRERGHRVMLVVPHSEQSGVRSWTDETYSLPALRRFPFSVLSHMILSTFWGVMAARKFRPDVVYCRGAHLNVTAVSIALVSGAPLVTEINGMIEDEVRGSLRRFLVRLFQHIQLRRSRFVVTVSGLLKQSLLRRYRLHPEDVLLVPNGADLSLFYPRDRLTARKMLGIPPETATFVYAGSFYVEHRLDVAIEAFRSLVRKGGFDFRAIFIGEGADRSRIMAMAGRSGMEERCLFPGEISHERVPEHLAAADAGMLFTVGDASPVKLYEYMAMGMPVVAMVSSPEVADFIRRAGLGVVHRSTGEIDRDAAELGNLLRKIAEDADGRKSMGERGLRLARERYNWDRAAGEIEEALRRPLSAGRGL